MAIKNTKYYIDIYKKEFNNYKEEQILDGVPEDEIDSAAVDYSEEGVVGYYLFNFGEDAFEEWNNNTKGTEQNSFGRKIYYLLRSISNKKKKKNTFGLVLLSDIIREKDISNRLADIINYIEDLTNYEYYISHDFNDITEVEDILRLDLEKQDSSLKYTYIGKFDDLIINLLREPCLSFEELKECYTGIDLIEKLNDKVFLETIKNELF